MTAGRNVGNSASSACRTAEVNRGGRDHDEVDEEGAPAQSQLSALPAQVGDRSVHLGDGARPHTRSLVQDAVDGGRAQPGLLGDVADAVRRPGDVSPAPLRSF